MLLGGLEFVLLGLLLAGAAAVVLAIISIVAVMEIVSEYWNELDDGAIIDPKLSRELEEIVKKKGNMEHKRVVWNKKTKEALIVQSNSISPELEDEEFLTISTRR